MRTVIVLILTTILTVGCVLPPAPDVPRTQYRIYYGHSQYKAGWTLKVVYFNEHGRYEEKKRYVASGNYGRVRRYAYRIC